MASEEAPPLKVWDPALWGPDAEAANRTVLCHRMDEGVVGAYRVVLEKYLAGELKKVPGFKGMPQPPPPQTKYPPRGTLRDFLWFNEDSVRDLGGPKFGKICLDNLAMAIEG